jgi:hypothetical protein
VRAWSRGNVTAKKEKTRMKQLIVICLVCILTAAASQGAIAPVSVGINISFDENGNGSWQSAVGGGTLDHGMGIPIGAGTSDQYDTLYYELPGIVVVGDLVLYEPTTGQVSDVLRFVNSYNPTTGPKGRVYVYSDMEAGETNPELADTRIPYDFLSLSVRTDEQGTENGWNGIVYTPNNVTDMPGYMTGYGVTYTFTSDVPEPATIGILGLGALSLLRKRRA